MKEINESKLLIEIEDFILDVDRRKHRPIGFYIRFANLLVSFIEVYDNRYSYFGCIQAFVDFMQDYEDFIWSKRELLIEELERIPFREIKQYFSSYVRQHKRKIRDHRASEKNNKQELANRMENVSDRYSKILVVRVDLFYFKDIQHLIGIDDFYRHVDELREYINSGDTVFRDLEESAWALEQGRDKGYHCHLLLVYNGHKRQSGIDKAWRVGELWYRITEKNGHYFNCHDSKHLSKFERNGTLGIGMIYRDNAEQVKNMLNTVTYLVRPEKEDQHLRVKTKMRMRTFG